MNVIRFSDLCANGSAKGKRVFIRADLNVPQDDDGQITEDTRIRASIPCIEMALAAGAVVSIVSFWKRAACSGFVSVLNSSKRCRLICMPSISANPCSVASQPRRVQPMLSRSRAVFGRDAAKSSGLKTSTPSRAASAGASAGFFSSSSTGSVGDTESGSTSRPRFSSACGPALTVALFCRANFEPLTAEDVVELIRVVPLNKACIFNW